MHGFCVRLFPPALRSLHGFALSTPRNRLASSWQNKSPSCFQSSFPIQRHNALLPVPKPSVTPEVKYEFTPAHLARAASQAIRMAIREGNLHTAYDVVNSMLHSPIDTRIRAPHSYLGVPSVIKFGRPLPIRLAAHSLIHCLLQEKLTIEAGKYLQRLIASGVRFHTKTLEANVSLLCSQPSRVPQQGQFVPELMANPTSPWDDSEASRTLLSQSTRLNPEVHLAMNILTTARQSRHRRTEWMYGRVVDACLLQGEIVVATLLFVILVKDWQLRKVMQSSPARLEDATAEEGQSVFGRDQGPKGLLGRGLPSLSRAKRLGFGDPKFAVPYPEKTILQSILNNINHHILSRDTQDIVRVESVESLSILADLLQQRSLPFGQIAPLLRTLQNCPASPSYRTGLLRKGCYVDVNTYDQVHKVLNQVCLEPSTTGPKPSLENPRLQPRLDLRAYNCLIFYALRHRLSPGLANKVMEHMMIHRQPPLQPDSVTYNTLLRSSTLLRRNDIADEVLKALRQRSENSNHPISKFKLDLGPRFDAQPAKQGHKKLAPFYHRIQAESIIVPEFVGTHGRPMLRADLHTLSTFITHLVSIGRPDIVADMVFDLLPELHIIDHPATNSSAPSWSPEKRQQRRRECIARAVEYGPYVFSALLNALRKAGETGLAERVWILARQAERASWMPRDDVDSLPPWCLPIEAYTSLMQCYANESKKGLTYIRESRFSQSLNESLFSIEKGAAWQLSQNQRSKIYVKGWAYFFLRMRAKEQGHRGVEPPLRLYTARAIGWLLHEAMRKGAISVWQELKQVQQGRVQQYPSLWAARLQSLHLPVPDARFFNAVLDIFGRCLRMQKRRVHASPSWWIRKIRIARERFANTGRVSRVYDRTLIDIARSMAQAGYPLPLGLQRALVGRVAIPMKKNVIREHKVRPWAFPPRHKSEFRPFSLPCTRERGLPLGRSRPSHFRRSKRRRGGPGHRGALAQV